MRDQPMQRLVLPPEAWPVADRAMWTDLVREDSLFGGAGALARTREPTRRIYCERYGRWLAWLTHREPAALADPPVSRVSPERLRSWLREMEALAPASGAAYVAGVLVILRAAALEADWRTQNRLLAVLRSRLRHGLQSRRKDGRIVSSQVLFETGVKLATEKADRDRTALKAAKARRDGAMVALLACLPMRRRAFIGLEIGVSLLTVADGYRIALSAEMTKTGRCWEAPVPEPVVPVLRRYLEEVRPWLLSRGRQVHDIVWVDNRGKPYAADYWGMRIQAITEHLTGVRVSPHLFRDAAATTLCRSSPKDARLVRALLGHSSFEMAERHYNHATSLEAHQTAPTWPSCPSATRWCAPVERAHGPGMDRRQAGAHRRQGVDGLDRGGRGTHEAPEPWRPRHPVRPGNGRRADGGRLGPGQAQSPANCHRSWTPRGPPLCGSG